MESSETLKEYLEKASSLIEEVFRHPPTVSAAVVKGLDFEGTGPDEEGIPVSFPAISIEDLWYAHPTEVGDIKGSSWRLEKIDPEDGLLLEIGEWDTFDEALFQIIVSISAQFAYEILEGGEVMPDAVVTVHREGMDITVAFIGDTLEAIDEDGNPIELTEEEATAAQELVNAGVNEMGVEIH